MTIYSLDVLLSQFGASLLFYVPSNYSFLTCIQISQEAGKVVCYFCLSKNFPQFIVIYTVKVFSVVNKAGVFLGFSSFLYDPMDVDNLISGSSAFSKSNLDIWEFSVHVQLKPRLENLTITLLVYEVSAIVW